MAEEKEVQEQEQEIDIEDKEKDFELEIEDDTPEQDRNRQPLPKEMVQDLEEDELEEYSEKVKTRLKQMKKSGTTSAAKKKALYVSSKRQLTWLKIWLKRIKSSKAD
jgi:hypothetical protein